MCLRGKRVKFVFEGHRIKVKVKVTRSQQQKKVANVCLCIDQLQQFSPVGLLARWRRGWSGLRLEGNSFILLSSYRPTHLSRLLASYSSVL